VDYLEIAKKLVKPVVHGLGIDIVRYPRVEPKPQRLIQRPFNVLEFVVDHRIRSAGTSIYFVQVGASNGVRWDPLRDLIFRYHLSGLLIEPLPDAFEQLRQGYADEPQLSFENCAIASDDGMKSLFRVKANAPYGDWAQGVASFSRKHVLAHLRDEPGDEREHEQYIEEVQVPTITVNTLLQKHRLPEITLLQIDTEGYDFEILKMFFAAHIFPEIVNFERVHLPFRNQQESRYQLIKHGYRFVDVGIDTLAIRAGSSWPPHNEGTNDDIEFPETDSDRTDKAQPQERALEK